MKFRLRLSNLPIKLKNRQFPLAMTPNENYYHFHYQLRCFMYVCLCHGITDKDIKNLVREEGVGSIRELKEHVSLGSQCGTCTKTAQSIIDNTIIDESLFKDVG